VSAGYNAASRIAFLGGDVRVGEEEEEERWSFLRFEGTRADVGQGGEGERRPRCAIPGEALARVLLEIERDHMDDTGEERWMDEKRRLESVARMIVSAGLRLEMAKAVPCALSIEPQADAGLVRVRAAMAMASCMLQVRGLLH
jgi:hypothetical protein